MKKLFEYADAYVARSDWKDLAMLKICLFSIGLIAGVFIPGRHKKAVVTGAAVVFFITYIPLMAKFFDIMETDCCTDDCCSQEEPTKE